MTGASRNAIAILLGIIGSACGGDRAAAPAGGHTLAFGISNRAASLLVGTSLLLVGESFRPDAALTSCNGLVLQSDTFVWSVADATIARVDAGSGDVVGLRSGKTNVRATSNRSGLWRELTITVVDR